MEFFKGELKIDAALTSFALEDTGGKGGEDTPVGNGDDGASNEGEDGANEVEAAPESPGATPGGREFAACNR